MITTIIRGVAPVGSSVEIGVRVASYEPISDTHGKIKYEKAYGTVISVDEVNQTMQVEYDNNNTILPKINIDSVIERAERIEQTIVPSIHITELARCVNELALIVKGILDA